MDLTMFLVFLAVFAFVFFVSSIPNNSRNNK